jgi:hypothetical protein
MADFIVDVKAKIRTYYAQDQAFDHGHPDD